MKNILVISGSARKQGDGMTAFRIFERQFETDAYKFEVLHLSDYNLEYCIGCTVCFKEEKCFKNDDIDFIIEKMRQADGFVFITPIYNMNISGTLKTLLDRTTYLLHKPVFFDKHSYIICSTDLAGSGPVKFYLKYIMNAYCIENAGAVSVLSHKIRHDNQYLERLSSKLGAEAQKFKKALAKGGTYQPNFAQLVRFNLWREKAKKSKDIYPGDYGYWTKEDLVDAEYFYPVQISVFKRLLIRIIKFRINRLIDKSL